MPMQVVFFGSSPLSNVVLQKVLSAKCEVLSVVTKPDMPSGRGQKMVPNPVKVLAEKNGIEVFTSIEHLSLNTEHPIGLVAAYGKIIPQSILDIFGGQIYNIHPSLLPKYRGASPLPSQILDGVTESGVTIIQIDSQMDHGPIVAQQKDKILPDDTWLTLGERLFSMGADLFLSVRYPVTGDKLREQDHSEATYTKKILREDGFIEWDQFKNQLNTEHLSLNTKLRAYAGWPGVWTTMPDGKRLKLVALKPIILVQVEGKSLQPWPI